MRIGIVGLGLIGGSLALSLRRAQSRAQQGSAHAKANRRERRLEIVGIDTNERSLAAAKRGGAIDHAAHPDRAEFASCDLIVLATPTPALLASLPRIAAQMHAGALLTDVCGVKELPTKLGAAQGHVVFVGAHPMAGREERGFAAAREDLFDGACVALCPAVGISDGNRAWSSAAQDAVRALWRDAGATRFLTLTSREHDRAVAYASHLPALAAASVFAALEQSGASGEIARALAAGGFRDTTRLAADGTVGQAAVHNRFLPEVLRDVAASLTEYAKQIEDGLHSNDLAELARTLEQLAERRRAMRLPPRR